MALSVNDPEAVELARLLANRMGETIDQAVVTALRERLARASEPTAGTHGHGELLAIGRECAALPDYDPRSPDEILGYDDQGVPG